MIDFSGPGSPEKTGFSGDVNNLLTATKERCTNGNGVFALERDGAVESGDVHTP